MTAEVDPTTSLDLFFEMSLDHLVIAGFDGYFKRLSRAWLTTFGWSMEEFLSRPNVEFVHPEDRAKTLGARDGLIDGVPLTGLVNRYLCKDGSFRWMEWRSVGLAEHGLVYAVARDVTAQVEAQKEQERAQSQMVVAERMASLGRLARGVAHEINNPLAFIISNLRVVLEELGDSGAAGPDAPGILGEALEGAERIKAIVRGLQTFTRTDAEQQTAVDLRSLVELTLTLLANELRQHGQLVERLGDVPWVLADQARLGQVLIALLTNAAQAAAPGRTGGHRIEVSTSTDGRGWAVIAIRDNGVGIPAATLPRIFEPFYTTRPPGKGTGLGLWSCHAIVSALGGDITVESEPGQGTQVCVLLPPAPE